MTRLSRLAAVWAALSLTACATTLGPPQPYPRPAENWTPVEAELTDAAEIAAALCE